MTNSIRNSTVIALIILAAMFGLLVSSIRNESAIVDELAHVPAGYGYMAHFDYRLNPEHPPLLKAASGLFIRIFTNSYFPTDAPSWASDINGQWGMGYTFLYGVGNNADDILFWARIPIILLSVCLGFLLYHWTRKRFGSHTALLALALYSFSPTILAHSRYVTTDLGASFGFFIGIASFISLLEKPTIRSAVVAGICFGIAQLLKFSLVLLVPMCGIIFILWVLTAPSRDTRERWRHALSLFGKILLGLLVATLVIWSVYAVFVYNYPQERQINDATFLLSSYGFRAAVNADIWLMRNSFTRSMGQYILGVLMVQQRAAGGNTAFFLDEVSSAGSRLYFPLLYLLKEPLPFHILTLCALWYAVIQFFARRHKPKISLILESKEQIISRNTWRDSIQRHFVQWSCVIVIATYWIVSIKSPLNIGVRHVMPTFPFIYLLISYAVMRWIRPEINPDPKTWRMFLGNIYEITIKALPKYFLLALLLVWLIGGTLIISPHFLPFYNELAGGTLSGWKYAVDSNYDWGQDLKRLADFVEKNNINKITLDYFGGGVPQYYLGSRVEPWSSSRGQPKGWFAISATFRQGAFGTPVAGFIRKPEDSYEWLKSYPPLARAGYSIFIYKLPE